MTQGLMSLFRVSATTRGNLSRRAPPPPPRSHSPPATCAVSSHQPDIDIGVKCLQDVLWRVGS